MLNLSGDMGHCKFFLNARRLTVKTQQITLFYFIFLIESIYSVSELFLKFKQMTMRIKSNFEPTTLGMIF